MNDNVLYHAYQQKQPKMFRAEFSGPVRTSPEPFCTTVHERSQDTPATHGAVLTHPGPSLPDQSISSTAAEATDPAKQSRETKAELLVARRIIRGHDSALQKLPLPLR
jgi:hypothetical protein